MFRSILILFFLLPTMVFSQAINDTILLKPIEISTSGSDLFFMDPISANILQADRNMAVDQVLSHYTTIFIKSYAPGGMSTISHHGFGASQTLLCWNGFVLNQPTLGLPSFSGLNTSDDMSIAILSGSVAAADFAGGLASVIRLRNMAPSDTNTHFGLMLHGGSFSSEGLVLNAGFGVGKALIRTELSLNRAENNYIFTNNSTAAEPTDWPLQNRINSGYSDVSFRSTVLFPVGKRRIEVSLWAASQKNDVAAPLLSQQIAGNESQQSRFVRFSSLIPLKIGGKTIVNARLFLSADTFLYENKQLSISDGTATQVLAAQLEARSVVAKNSSLHLQYYPEMIRVVSDNYVDLVHVTDQRFKALWSQRSKLGRFDLWSHAVSRNVANVFLLPGFAWYAPTDSIPVKIRLGIARNMRQPSMNDLYWATGGNRNLLPEEAWMTDLTFAFQPLKKHRFDVSARLIPFAAQTQNLIRWIPDTLTSIWHANNVSESRQYGVEFFVDGKYSVGSFNFFSSLNLSRVFAYDLSGEEKKFLTYVPDKTLNWSLKIGRGSLSAGYAFHCTGQRYTDFDNLRYMPEIFLHDVWMAVEKKMGKQTVLLSLQINNILNADYQYVAWYPMPRRHFRFTLSWRFDG